MTAKSHRRKRRRLPPVDATQLAFSVPDAARLLDVSRNTVWTLIQRGRLHKVDFGDLESSATHCVRISREELDRFLRSRPATVDGGESKERPRRDAA